MQIKLAAAIEAARALKDIHNASGNNQPYSYTELGEMIDPILCQLEAAFGIDRGEL